MAVEDKAPDRPAEGGEEGKHEEDAEPAEVAGGGGVWAGAVDVLGELAELAGGLLGGVGRVGGVGVWLLGVEALDPGAGVKAENAEVVAQNAVTENAAGELVEVAGLECEEVAHVDAGDFGDGVEGDAEPLALPTQIIGKSCHALRSGEADRSKTIR